MNDTILTPDLAEPSSYKGASTSFDNGQYDARNRIKILIARWVTVEGEASVTLS